MKYEKRVTLKNGKELLLRSADASDASEVLQVFLQTRGETDYLLNYPEECTFTAEQEAEFLQNKADSEHEVELLALLDGVVVGTAGIDAAGTAFKMRHRADFGISILKAYWGMGIGRALMNAAVACARQAGFTQLELGVVAENRNAAALYESAGFTEYGRNPRGFYSKYTGYQELIYMRLELR